MRKLKMYLHYASTDRLDSLPLFSYWKPVECVENDARKQAAEWVAWRAQKRWWNILGIGEPQITSWNLYICHLDELAYELDLSFDQLIAYRTHHAIEYQLVIPMTELLLKSAREYFVRRNQRQSRSAFKKYVQLTDAAVRFRLLDNARIFTTYEKFIQSIDVEEEIITGR